MSTAHVSKLGTMSTALIVALLLALPVLQLVVAVEADDGGLDPNNWQPCGLRDPLMDPTHEKRYRVDVVWQIPPNPKAILLFAHGSGMEPLGYFDPGPNCRQCYGLPEDRTVVLEALRRRYAVISVKSIGPLYDTFFRPLEESKDLVIVTTVVKEWSTEHGLEGLPLASWGHSAGTTLAEAVTTTLPMQALVLMCGGGHHGVQNVATPSTHPPTFFAYMPMDENVPNLNVTLEDADCMAVLTARGVQVAETKCWPKPLSPLFFTERILCMSDDMSRNIFAAYESAGWLDSQGYLTVNPREDAWESVLFSANALPFCSESGNLCLANHVAEELNMAFAQHSLTSDANDVIFPWLDSTILASPNRNSLEPRTQLDEGRSGSVLAA